MPITDVEAIFFSHWVVTAVIQTFPSRLLTARNPLARHPPAAHFFRMGGILKIQKSLRYYPDSLPFRGEINVPLIHGETVGAPAWSVKESDFAGLGAI